MCQPVQVRLCQQQVSVGSPGAFVAVGTSLGREGDGTDRKCIDRINSGLTELVFLFYQCHLMMPNLVCRLQAD